MTAAVTGLVVIIVVLIFGLVVWQWRAAVGEQVAAHERKKQARLNDAALLTDVVSQAQQLYSTEVVDVVNRVPDSKVTVSHNYGLKKDGTIPLPPTLTIILADRISQKKLGTVRLYSEFPFKPREPRPLDRFEKDALEALTKSPHEPFYRFEDWEGRPTLRYASADVMHKGCVECHNQHKDSRKRDWKEGDVRGVLEVILPLE